MQSDKPPPCVSWHIGHNPQGTSLKGMVAGIGCWMFALKRCNLRIDDRCGVVCKIHVVL